MKLIRRTDSEPLLNLNADSSREYATFLGKVFISFFPTHVKPQISGEGSLVNTFSLFSLLA